MTVHKALEFAVKGCMTVSFSLCVSSSLETNQLGIIRELLVYILFQLSHVFFPFEIQHSSSLQKRRIALITVDYDYMECRIACYVCKA